MKFLIVTQYFWPESFIINDLVRTLRRQKHDVVVATGKPNYPGGRVYDGYEASGIQRETFDEDVEIIRVPLRPRGAGGAVGLALNYLSFAFSGAWRYPRLLDGRQFDAIVVFAMSPITAAIPAIRVKRRVNAHLAIWIQDLWPDSLEGTGYVRNRFLLKLVGLLVRGIYGAADTLLVQSKAFAEPVSQYGALSKIVYYPNSIAAASTANPGDGEPPSELTALLEAHFCVVFAGNIGTAQDVETIVGVAARLKDLPDVRVVLVGAGSMMSWVQQQIDEHRLDNVVLAGSFPATTMPAIYRRAACLLVTLKSRRPFSFTIPSKVQAYMAAGRPIVAGLSGEGGRVVREAGAGVTCESEDVDGLERCIRSVHAMPVEERARMGAAGRAYFLEHFEMDRQAQRLVTILEGRIAQSKGTS